MKQESRIERRVMYVTKLSMSLVEGFTLQSPNGEGWVFESVECKAQTVLKPKSSWGESDVDHYVTIISHWSREMPSGSDEASK